VPGMVGHSSPAVPGAELAWLGCFSPEVLTVCSHRTQAQAIISTQSAWLENSFRVTGVREPLAWEEGTDPLCAGGPGR
jgi:hypothetical protein